MTCRGSNMAHIMAHPEGSFRRSAHDPLRPTSAASHIAGLRPHAANHKPLLTVTRIVFLTVTGNRGRHEAAVALMKHPAKCTVHVNDTQPLTWILAKPVTLITDDAAHSAGLTLGSNAAPDRGRKRSPFEADATPHPFQCSPEGLKIVSFGHNCRSKLYKSDT